MDHEIEELGIGVGVVGGICLGSWCPVLAISLLR